MKLPLLDDLIDEQLNVYEASLKENLFVLGPPGSGKTTMAVHRIKRLLGIGSSSLLLTKNRMLAALAGQLGDNSFTTLTMNSFITSEFYRRFGRNAPEPKPFAYDWQEIMDEYEKAKVTPILDHLIIDEGQNLPSAFYAWAVRFGAKNVSVFADEDQTTLPQRASIEEICAAPMPEPIRLSENHRNTQEIARVAEHFHKSRTLPPAIVRRPRSGNIPTIEKVKTWSEVVNLVKNRLKNRGESIGVIVRLADEAETLKRMLQKELPSSRIDAYTSKNKSGSEKNIQLMTPGVTVLTGESAIGLEFDTVYLQDLARSLPCVQPDQYRRLYMLCARARDNLALIDGPSALTASQYDSLPDKILLLR